MLAGQFGLSFRMSALINKTMSRRDLERPDARAIVRLGDAGGG
jgi:hypothetical protein